jgi:hypothetical protein
MRRTTRRASGPDGASRQPRIVHRTEQLPATSRVLYRIEHYSTLPTIGLVVIGSVIGGILFGVALGFPDRWVSVREQAATQRKLDELLRALPGADQSLMMLEEAPKEALLDVEEVQRGVRSSVE